MQSVSDIECCGINSKHAAEYYRQSHKCDKVYRRIGHVLGDGNRYELDLSVAEERCRYQWSDEQQLYPCIGSSK